MTWIALLVTNTQHPAVIGTRTIEAGMNQIFVDAQALANENGCRCVLLGKRSGKWDCWGDYPPRAVRVTNAAASTAHVEDSNSAEG
jgi:hypothetical protein